MQSESSNTSNKNIFSNPLKNKKEDIICKDGFCSISNHKDNSNIKKDDIGFFDPI